MYVALTAHFSDENGFDIDKYGADATKVSQEAYIKRNDHKLFIALANRYTMRQLYHIFMASLIESDTGHISVAELETSIGLEPYERWQSRIKRVTDRFIVDMVAIMNLLKSQKKSFRDLLTKGGHPVIIQLLIRNTITIESAVILEDLFGWTDITDKVYGDDPLWRRWRIRIRRYHKLAVINKDTAREIFKECRTKAGIDKL
ncbi:DNA helicase loader [Vibrio phage EniLVp02]